MKKFLMVMAAAVGLAGPVLAQTNNYSNADVRNPVVFGDKLNADLSATDTRLDALESSTNVNGAGVFASTTIGTLTVGTNATVAGTLGVSGASTLNTATITGATFVANQAASVRGASTFHTTSVTGALTAASTLDVTGIATFAATQNVFSAAASAAPTNAAVAGLRVRINGTNYWIAVSVPNS